MPPATNSRTKFYRDQLNKLANPPLGTWGELAMKHWRENLPEYVRHLGGNLRSAAILAQENAKGMYGEMVERGINPYSAEEIALVEFILLLPSEETTQQDIEVGAANQLAAFDLLLKSAACPGLPRVAQTSARPR